MAKTRLLELADLEAAFALVTQVFVSGSTLHRALGIELDAYRAYLRPSFEAMVQESLSVVAEASDGTLQGCMIAVDFHGPAHEAAQPQPPFAPVSALTSALCAEYLRARTFDPGEVLLVDMAAVPPASAGGGIYQEMRTHVHRLARERGFRSVVGELSSAATQHVVLNRLGHAKVVEIAFDAFRHGDGYPFRMIAQPRSIVLAEGAL